MIDYERMTSFIKSYIKDDEGELYNLYCKAKENGVPVMRETTRELMKVNLLVAKPSNILEIGTAVGYSSLYMSQYIGNEAKITTIELDDNRYSEACINIKNFGKDNVISVIHGDAAEVLEGLENDMYDMVFVDAAKGQYINYYENVLRVLKKGGLMISDNVLQDGEIMESHFAVEKRNRTIHDRMREYLQVITNDNRLETAILSVGDGVAISVKK